ncbi:MAG: acetolactate synthase [Verrucomicrobiales bacterium]
MEIGDPEHDITSAISSGSPVVQLVVFLENRAGALLSIVQLIADNNVLVLGLSVKDSVDSTVVRLIVSDPDKIETLFIEKGIAYSTTEVLVVELVHGAEDLPKLLRELLNAETNVHFLYPILTRPNGRAAMALCAEDNQFGKQVLNEAGYKVLMQEDLSR